MDSASAPQHLCFVKGNVQPFFPLETVLRPACVSRVSTVSGQNCPGFFTPTPI